MKAKLLLTLTLGLIIVAGLVFITRKAKTPTPVTGPAKIVEDVKKYLNIAKTVLVTSTTFEWRDETNVNGKIKCSDKPVSVSGYGFTTGDIESFSNPDLTKLGYTNGKISICNVAAGTTVSQVGYVVGDIVCVLKTELKTTDAGPSVTF